MESIGDHRSRPIGLVEKGMSRRRFDGVRKSRYEVVSRVRIHHQYADGLAGLEGYSHLILIWWMHREDEVRLKVMPRGSEGMREVGIFATRFPVRPNPIGVSIVELVQVSGNILKVKGFDAWTGSPILDIKPYDYYDIVKSARTPKWFRRCWEEHSTKRKASGATWLGP